MSARRTGLFGHRIVWFNVPVVKVVSLSASHRDLDLDLLVQFARAAGGLDQAVVAGRAARAAVVLATCNRLEVYLEVMPNLAAQAVESVISVLAREGDINAAAVRAALVRRDGPQAVEHLFAVASGLESMVVGEREIVGQVSRALDAAREAKTTGPLLERVFQDAIRVSREVERHTSLGSHGQSVLSVGLDLAAAHVEPWDQVSALLVGSGKYAGAAVAALRRRGCTNVKVYSPSGRADKFAAPRGLDAVAPGDLVKQLRDADIVVACSGRGDVVLDLEMASMARKGGDTSAPRPLVIVDVALTRDIDRAVGDLAGVTFFDLAKIKAHAPDIGIEPIRRARQVISAGVERWFEWRERRAAHHRVASRVQAGDTRLTGVSNGTRDPREAAA